MSELAIVISGGTGLEPSLHTIAATARAQCLGVIDIATGDSWSLRVLATIAPAWTAAVAARFVLMPRAAWLALTGPSPNPKLAGVTTALCTLIDAAGDQKRWKEASLTVGVPVVHPAQ
jgi:hypothetical protein